MSGKVDSTPSPRQIEDAKTLLDGARSIFEHAPTAEHARVVDGCEAHLNDLLDQYPRENRN